MLLPIHRLTVSLLLLAHECLHYRFPCVYRGWSPRLERTLPPNATNQDQQMATVSLGETCGQHTGKQLIDTNNGPRIACAISKSI